MLLRVQDKHGRGPWRPGLSEKWVDAWRQQQHPPIYEEIPDFHELVAKAHKDGLHIGCAVDGAEKLLSWFSVMELSRLHDLGFRIFNASDCAVLGKTETQVLVASRNHLRLLPPAMIGAV